jgi:hypothetical protein
MNATKIGNYVLYAMMFLAGGFAGLQSIEWTAYFEPKTALQIVGAINGFGVSVKAWISTAELMAKSMTTPPVQK